MKNAAGAAEGRLEEHGKSAGLLKMVYFSKKLRREFFSGEKRLPGILRFRVFILVLEGTGMWERHEMRNGNKGRVHLVRFTGYTLRGNFHRYQHRNTRFQSAEGTQCVPCRARKRTKPGSLHGIPQKSRGGGGAC